MELTIEAKRDLIQYIAKKYQILTTSKDKIKFVENEDTRSRVEPVISEDGLTIRWGGIYINNGNEHIKINAVAVLNDNGKPLFINNELVKDELIDQDGTYILRTTDSIRLSCEFSLA